MRQLLVCGLLFLATAVGAAGTGTSSAEHPCSDPELFGDLSRNGIIDGIDALWVLRGSAGYYLHYACYPPDVDCDGDIDAVDALKILRHVAGLEYSQVEPCPDIGTLLPGGQ